MILYVLLGFALASFVIAFFSAKTWHWGYVLVVEALFLATLGFFILAAETVRINAVLRGQVNRTQKDLDTFTTQNDALENGTSDSKIINQLSNLDPAVKMPADAETVPSIEQLDHELLIATRLRGRVWRNVKPSQPNAQTGVVNVSATPGIKPQTVVYVFEEGPAQPPAANGARRGPQYIGQFNVTQVGAQGATLQPSLLLDAYERKRLAASRGPWAIYETMPLDRHEIFAGMTEKELQQLLPKQSLKEYLRDGKPATSDDDPLRVVGVDENGNRLPPGDLAKAVKKLYFRRLHDYAAEFSELIRRRVVMLTDEDAVKKDIARLESAQQVADQLKTARQDEARKLKSDLAGVTKERDAIEQHLAGVKKLLARALELTADLQKKNDQLANELTVRQLGQKPAKPQGGGSETPENVVAPLALGKP